MHNLPVCKAKDRDAICFHRLASWRNTPRLPQVGSTHNPTNDDSLSFSHRFLYRILNVGVAATVSGEEFLQTGRAMGVRESRCIIDKTWGDDLIDHNIVSLTPCLLKHTARKNLVVFG